MREPFSIPGDLETWHPLSRKLAFLAKPATRRNFVWFLLTGMVVTSVLGLFVTAKKYAPWDFFASWTVWGFLSYCTVVLASWPMFRLTARAVDYYGPHEWTGGYERATKLAPAVPPEDHGNAIHTRPPLTTAPEDDPYATMPTGPLADTLSEKIVEPLRSRDKQRRDGGPADGGEG